MSTPLTLSVSSCSHVLSAHPSAAVYFSCSVLITVDERRSGRSMVHLTMLKLASMLPAAVPPSMVVKRALPLNSGAAPCLTPLGAYWLSSAAE